MVGLPNPDVDGEYGMYYRKDKQMYLISRKGSYRQGHSFLSNRCHWGRNRQVWLNQVLSLLRREKCPLLADILAVDLCLLAQDHYCGLVREQSRDPTWLIEECSRRSCSLENKYGKLKWQAEDSLGIQTLQLKA